MLEKKTKSFVKDHKRGIVLTGCVVAGVITGVVLCKRFDKEMVDLGKRICGKKRNKLDRDKQWFYRLRES